MFRTEMKAHAQEIFSHLLGAWLASHPDMPGPGEVRSIAERAVEFAKIFSEAAAPQE